MRMLLDTHTFMWWHSDDSKLSPTALAACKDLQNELVLSLASIWEMQIKSQLGKFVFAVPIRDLVDRHVASNSLELLPIATEHVYELGALPPLHRDPFDRLLVAQARVESLTLVTRDPDVIAYPVATLW